MADPWNGSRTLAALLAGWSSAPGRSATGQYMVTEFRARRGATSAPATRRRGRHRRRGHRFYLGGSGDPDRRRGRRCSWRRPGAGRPRREHRRPAPGLRRRWSPPGCRAGSLGEASPGRRWRRWCRRPGRPHRGRGPMRPVIGTEVTGRRATSMLLGHADLCATCDPKALHGVGARTRGDDGGARTAGWISACSAVAPSRSCCWSSGSGLLLLRPQHRPGGAAGRLTRWPGLAGRATAAGQARPTGPGSRR